MKKYVIATLVVVCGVVTLFAITRIRNPTENTAPPQFNEAPAVTAPAKRDRVVSVDSKIPTESPLPTVTSEAQTVPPVKGETTIVPPLVSEAPTVPTVNNGQSANQVNNGQSANQVKITSSKEYEQATNSLDDLVRFYANMDKEVSLEQLSCFNVSADEYTKVEEHIAMNISERDRLLRTSISKEELESYLLSGAYNFSSDDLTEQSYPITYRGELGYIPYITVNNTEYSLVLDDPDEYEAYVQGLYKNDVTIIDKIYDDSANTVVARTSNAHGQVTELTLTFDSTGTLVTSNRIIK